MSEVGYTVSTNSNASGRNTPIVLVLNDQGGGVMNVSYDIAHTLRAETKHHEPVVLVYESHNQDSRYNLLGDICETVSAKYGTGGGQSADSVKI